MNVLALLAALLAFLQLRSCASAVCAAMPFDGAAFARRSLSSAAVAPQNAIVLPGDVVATLTKPSDEAWRITVGDYAEELPLVSHAQEFGGGALVAAPGGGWWFASSGLRDGTYGTTFLAVDDHDGKVRQSFVAHPRSGPNLVLPLSGPDLRALHLSYAGGSLEALEVSPEGIRRTWRMEPPFRRTFIAGDWRAEALPGGRIAIVSIEHDGPDEAHIVLRVLATDAPVAAATLQKARILSQLATAVDGGGRLVVATTIGRPAGGIVEATRIDPSAPAPAPRWRELSEAGAFSPRVVASPAGTIVAWLRGSRALLQLEARDLDGDAPPLTIGSAGGRNRFDSFANVQAGEADQLTFVWTDEAGRLAARTIVAPLAGFALAERLRDAACAAARATGSTPGSSSPVLR